MSDASKGEHSGFLIRREAEWRAEFERDGEVLVYENFKQGAIYNDEKKRQAALKWLAEQARIRRGRESRTLQVAVWTRAAAILGVIIGIVGVIATLRH